jgi:thiol-disulfide isomerase/thioredoxin
MQRLLLLFILFSACSNTVFCKSQKIKVNTGSWTGYLKLNETTSLPFEFSINKNGASKTGYSYTVINGEERIELVNDYVANDSLRIDFPAFGTKMIFKVSNKSTLNGYWINPNKPGNYRIPCVLLKGYSKRFNNPKLNVSTTQSANVNGRWETTFDPGQDGSYKAVGLFKQFGNNLQGTFLTETGDFRYLDGNVVGDSLFLSCFDGSHAFLFTGKFSNNEITGNFYSGKHWRGDWSAVYNESFEIRDPDSLTYFSKYDPITFNLKNLDGSFYTFPNTSLSNKVVIIQIMGTWCPNCMDESRFFKTLYEKYHSKGLEIISVCYESGSDEKQQIERIKTLQQRLNVSFTYLLGGTANKGLASQHFNMLNQIISFPTAIFIGKDGSVKKIHTGFNGPGTGKYYEEYTVDTDSLIRSLLAE